MLEPVLLGSLPYSNSPNFHHKPLRRGTSYHLCSRLRLCTQGRAELSLTPRKFGSRNRKLPNSVIPYLSMIPIINIIIQLTSQDLCVFGVLHCSDVCILSCVSLCVYLNGLCTHCSGHSDLVRFWAALLGTFTSHQIVSLLPALGNCLKLRRGS